MDGIFMITFLSTLAGSFLIDHRMLRNERSRVRVTYGIITLLILGLFVGKYLHWRIPMPTRFFIYTVSPWLVRILGI